MESYARHIVIDRVEKPSFKKQSLTLSGAIGLNFFADLSSVPEEERALCKVQFKKYDGDGGVRSTSEYVYCDPDFRSSDGTLYGFSCPVTSVEMADRVEAELVYVRNGSTGSVTKSVRVADYIDYIDGHAASYGDKVVSLVRAMADYGHYAQPWLAAENNWTVGVEHAEMDMHFCEGFDRDEMLCVLEPYKFVLSDIDDPENTMLETSCYLNLGSGTKLAFSFDVDFFYDLDASCTFRGVEYGVVQGGKYQRLENNGYHSYYSWTITVPDIPAHMLGKEVAVDGASIYGGETRGSFRVRGSAYSYAEAVLRDVGSSQDAVNAVCALYAYGEVAKALRG